MTTERSYPTGVPCWVDTDQPDVDAARRDPQGAELTLSQFTPPQR
jgi:hypothetical protein